MELLEKGDVLGAREFFEIGVGDGHAASAHALTLTYDADSLRQRGLATTFADETQRARWAARAAALGGGATPSTASTPNTPSSNPSPPPLAPAGAAVASEPGLVITDGTYSTHVLASCGEAFQSVLVKIDRGTIAFEHLLQGVPYGWRGTIDAKGAIVAGVEGSAGHRAVGSFEEKTIDLTYPQCGATPVTMRIRWLVR